MPRGRRKTPYPTDHKPIPGRTPDDLAEENQSNYAIGPDGSLWRRSMFGGWLPIRHYLKPTTPEMKREATKVAQQATYLRPLARTMFGIEYLDQLQARRARQYVPHYEPPEDGE